MPIGTRVFQIAGALSLSLALVGVTSATATTKTKTKHTAHISSTHSTSHHSSSTRHVTKTAARAHGQHSIDEDRTRAIQEALIREHYMTGEPSGSWDDASKEAMVRYQAANGWQTKITPDSRALIKLGLGPDHKGLLNPETANIPSPHELGLSSATEPGGAADAQ